MLTYQRLLTVFAFSLFFSSFILAAGVEKSESNYDIDDMLFEPPPEGGEPRGPVSENQPPSTPAVSGGVDSETFPGDSSTGLADAIAGSEAQGLTAVSPEDAPFIQGVAAKTEALLSARDQKAQLSEEARRIAGGRSAQGDFSQSESSALNSLLSRYNQASQMIEDLSPPDNLRTPEQIVQSQPAQDLLRAGEAFFGGAYQARNSSTAGGSPRNQINEARKNYEQARSNFYRFSYDNNLSADLMNKTLGRLSQMAQNPNNQEGTIELDNNPSLSSGAGYELGSSPPRDIASLNSQTPTSPKTSGNGQFVSLGNGKTFSLPKDLSSGNFNQGTKKVERLTDDFGNEISHSESHSQIDSKVESKSEAKSSAQVIMQDNRKIIDPNDLLAMLNGKLTSSVKKKDSKDAGTVVGRNFLADIAQPTLARNKGVETHRPRYQEGVLDTPLGASKSSPNGAKDPNSPLENQAETSSRAIASTLNQPPSAKMGLWERITSSINRTFGTSHSPKDLVYILFSLIILLVLAYIVLKKFNSYRAMAKTELTRGKVAEVTHLDHRPLTGEEARKLRTQVNSSLENKGNVFEVDESSDG